jgi:hypothetical protein
MLSCCCSTVHVSQWEWKINWVRVSWDSPLFWLLLCCTFGAWYCCCHHPLQYCAYAGEDLLGFIEHNPGIIEKACKTSFSFWLIFQNCLYSPQNLSVTVFLPVSSILLLPSLPSVKFVFLCLLFLLSQCCFHSPYDVNFMTSRERKHRSFISHQ